MVLEGARGRAMRTSSGGIGIGAGVPRLVLVALLASACGASSDAADGGGGGGQDSGAPDGGGGGAAPDAGDADAEGGGDPGQLVITRVSGNGQFGLWAWSFGEKAIVRVTNGL